MRKQYTTQMYRILIVYWYVQLRAQEQIRNIKTILNIIVTSMEFYNLFMI